MIKKKHKKAAFGLMATGIGLGVGSQVLGDAGSTHGQTAIGNISSKLPIMGKAVGAGMVMDAVGSLGKKRKKKGYF
jgi:hypothetical protein